MNLDQYNIEELILLCKQKNQKAQCEVYNRYAKAMYNVSFRIVKDAHFAEDVMQEGFMKAFTKINDYKQEVAFAEIEEKLRNEVDPNNQTVVIRIPYDLQVQDLVDLLQIGVRLNVKFVIATDKQ